MLRYSSGSFSFLASSGGVAVALIGCDWAVARGATQCFFFVVSSTSTSGWTFISNDR